MLGRAAEGEMRGMKIIEMKIVGKVAVGIFFLAGPLLAQQYVTSTPPLAMTAPVFEASAGYTFLDMDTS
jgi:hypothetical protein